ncbi:hypothetical protein FHX72_002470 [Pseudoclavibacter helvolus]|uniref:Uncharacterized protein n=1 Tax=Pseudoclavibacter helvolus TaxID=255205 RepID=A0A7W4YGW7_9MICO|nr:hypothetical protein [Pseudoclavibacter helvolus]
MRARFALTSFEIGLGITSFDSSNSARCVPQLTQEL